MGMLVHSSNISKEDVIAILDLLRKRCCEENGSIVARIRGAEIVEFPFLFTEEDCRDCIEWSLHLNENGKKQIIRVFEKVMFHETYVFVFNKCFIDYYDKEKNKLNI